MKIRLVGAELFHADGRADEYRQTDEATRRCNFGNAPKKIQKYAI